MNKRDEAVWAAVEADFRGGKLSNRQIAKRHGVSEAAIRKRSETEGWVRTLAESAQGAHFGGESRFTPVSPPGTRETPRSERLAQNHVELGSDLAFRMLSVWGFTRNARPPTMPTAGSPAGPAAGAQSLSGV